jgi:hypothetical protein
LRVCFGLKAHCGWCVLVVLGCSGGEPCVVDRRRIELVDPANSTWAKQPYHAADGLEAEEARRLVERGVAFARRTAVRQLKAEVKRSQGSGHAIAGCAVVMPEPMPDWSVDQVLAVHLRMHQAEGVLFADALARAAQACGLPLLAIREKRLIERAQQALVAPASRLADQVGALGKSIGPPWGKDQKAAALAAMIALRTCRPGKPSNGLPDPSDGFIVSV